MYLFTSQETLVVTYKYRLSSTHLANLEGSHTYLLMASGMEEPFWCHQCLQMLEQIQLGS